MQKRIRNNLWYGCGIDKYRLLDFVLKEQGITEYEVEHDAEGRPILKVLNRKCLSPHISLSDSWNCVAVGISWDGPIGIDVQRKCDRKRVSRRFFSFGELMMPFSLVWARKEAYAKYLGTGLSWKALDVDTATLQFEDYDIATDYYLSVYEGEKEKEA